MIKGDIYEMSHFVVFSTKKSELVMFAALYTGYLVFNSCVGKNCVIRIISMYCG